MITRSVQVFTSRVSLYFQHIFLKILLAFLFLCFCLLIVMSYQKAAGICFLLFKNSRLKGKKHQAKCIWTPEYDFPYEMFSRYFPLCKTVSDLNNQEFSKLFRRSKQYPEVFDICREYDEAKTIFFFTSRILMDQRIIHVYSHYDHKFYFHERVTVWPLRQGYTCLGYSKGSIL